MFCLAQSCPTVQTCQENFRQEQCMDKVNLCDVCTTMMCLSQHLGPTWNLDLLARLHPSSGWGEMLCVQGSLTAGRYLAIFHWTLTKTIIKKIQRGICKFVQDPLYIQINPLLELVGSSHVRMMFYNFFLNTVYLVVYRTKQT